MSWREDEELKKLQAYVYGELNKQRYQPNPQQSVDFYKRKAAEQAAAKAKKVKEDTSKKHSLLDAMKKNKQRLVEATAKDFSDGVDLSDIGKLALRPFAMLNPFNEGIIDGKGSSVTKEKGITGLAGRAGSNFTSGTGNIVKGVGDIMQYVGAKDGNTNGMIDKAGKSISNFAEKKMVDPYHVGYAEQTGHDFTWKSLMDPEFYATTVAEGMPFALSFFIPGLAGAKLGSGIAGGIAKARNLSGFSKTVAKTAGAMLGGTALSTPLESAFEAGSVYDEMVKNGKSHEEADAAADSTFWKNMAVLGASNAVEFGTIGAKILAPGIANATSRLTSRAAKAGVALGKAGATGVMEGWQEGKQEEISADATGRVLTDAQKGEAQAAGFVMGAGMGLLGNIHDANHDIPGIQSRAGEADQEAVILNNVLPRMSPELTEEVNNFRDALEENGHPAEDIEQQVKDFLDSTEEGNRLIQEETEREVKRVQGEQTQDNQRPTETSVDGENPTQREKQESPNRPDPGTPTSSARHEMPSVFKKIWGKLLPENNPVNQESPVDPTAMEPVDPTASLRDQIAQAAEQAILKTGKKQVAEQEAKGSSNHPLQQQYKELYRQHIPLAEEYDTLMQGDRQANKERIKELDKQLNPIEKQMNRVEKAANKQGVSLEHLYKETMDEIKNPPKSLEDRRSEHEAKRAEKTGKTDEPLMVFQDLSDRPGAAERHRITDEMPTELPVQEKEMVSADVEQLIAERDELVAQHEELPTPGENDQDGWNRYWAQAHDLEQQIQELDRQIGNADVQSAKSKIQGNIANAQGQEFTDPVFSGEDAPVGSEEWADLTPTVDMTPEQKVNNFISEEPEWLKDEEPKVETVSVGGESRPAGKINHEEMKKQKTGKKQPTIQDVAEESPNVEIIHVTDEEKKIIRGEKPSTESKKEFVGEQSEGDIDLVGWLESVANGQPEKHDEFIFQSNILRVATLVLEKDAKRLNQLMWMFNKERDLNAFIEFTGADRSLLGKKVPDKEYPTYSMWSENNRAKFIQDGIEKVYNRLGSTPSEQADSLEAMLEQYTPKVLKWLEKYYIKGPKFDLSKETRAPENATVEYTATYNKLREHEQGNIAAMYNGFFSQYQEIQKVIEDLKKESEQPREKEPRMKTHQERMDDLANNKEAAAYSKEFKVGDRVFYANYGGGIEEATVTEVLPLQYKFKIDGRTEPMLTLFKLWSYEDRVLFATRKQAEHVAHNRVNREREELDPEKVAAFKKEYPKGSIVYYKTKGNTAFRKGEIRKHHKTAADIFILKADGKTRSSNQRDSGWVAAVPYEDILAFNEFEVEQDEDVVEKVAKNSDDYQVFINGDYVSWTDHNTNEIKTGYVSGYAWDGDKKGTQRPADTILVLIEGEYTGKKSPKGVRAHVRPDRDHLEVIEKRPENPDAEWFIKDHYRFRLDLDPKQLQERMKEAGLEPAPLGQILLWKNEVQKKPAPIQREIEKPNHEAKKQEKTGKKETPKVEYKVGDWVRLSVGTGKYVKGRIEKADAAKNEYTVKPYDNVYSDITIVPDSLIKPWVEENNANTLGVIDENQPLPFVDFKATKTRVTATFVPITRDYSFFKSVGETKAQAEPITWIFPVDKSGFVRLPKQVSVADIHDKMGIEFYQEGVRVQELIATFHMMNNQSGLTQVPEELQEKEKTGTEENPQEKPSNPSKKEEPQHSLEGKIYFSLSPNTSDLDAIKQEKPEYVLVSFANWHQRFKNPKNMFEELLGKIGYRPKTILDSGAYSFREDNEDFYELMEALKGKDLTNPMDVLPVLIEKNPKVFEYMNYAKEFEGLVIDKVMSFDVFGDPQASDFGYELLKNAIGEEVGGVIPVFQAGKVVDGEYVVNQDFRTLDKYAKESDIVAIGGTAIKGLKGFTIQKRAEIVNTIINRYPKTKFHLLGTIDRKLIDLIPNIHSVDGKSWVHAKGGVTQEEKTQKSADNIRKILGTGFKVGDKAFVELGSKSYEVTILKFKERNGEQLVDVRTEDDREWVVSPEELLTSRPKAKSREEKEAEMLDKLQTFFEEADGPAPKEPTKYDKAHAQLKWLDDLADRAEDYWKKNKGRANFLPADLFAAGVIMGARKMAHGIVDFAQWSEEMVKSYGEEVRLSLWGLHAQADAFLNKMTQEQRMDYLRASQMDQLAEGLENPEEAPQETTEDDGKMTEYTMDDIDFIKYNGTRQNFMKELEGDMPFYPDFIRRDKPVQTSWFKDVSGKAYGTFREKNGKWQNPMPAEQVLKFLKPFDITNPEHQRLLSGEKEDKTVFYDTTLDDLAVNDFVAYTDMGGDEILGFVDHIDEDGNVLLANEKGKVFTRPLEPNRLRHVGDDEKAPPRFRKRQEALKTEPELPTGIESRDIIPDGFERAGVTFDDLKNGQVYYVHALEKAFGPYMLVRGKIQKLDKKQKTYYFEYNKPHVMTDSPGATSGINGLNPSQLLVRSADDTGEIEKGSGKDVSNTENSGTVPNGETAERVPGNEKDGQTQTVSHSNGTESNGTTERNDNGESGTESSRDGVSPERSGDNEKIPSSPRNADGGPLPVDHVITDNIYESGKVTRFNNNIAALQLLKVLQAEKRYASAEEQEVLAKYQGWGGLSEYFDTKKPELYAELQAYIDDLFTQEEYESMRKSTTTSFYTNHAIATAMYDVLEKAGFKGGRILEPSVGTGMFLGSAPESMKKSSKFITVEKDRISHLITKYLYPNQVHYHKGFEQKSFGVNSFDVVIGNVPFSETFGVSDTNYRDRSESKGGKKAWVTKKIHNYFLVRSMDLLRPGGIGVLITATNTMDNLDDVNTKTRKYLYDQADILDVVRLPNSAFKDAGTDVATDIIFFRKKDPAAENIHPNDITHSSWYQGNHYDNHKESNAKLNSFFKNHPDRVAGEIEFVSGRYGKNELKYHSAGFEKKFERAMQSVTNEFKDKFVPNIEDTDIVKLENAIEEDWATYEKGVYDGAVHNREGKLVQYIYDKWVPFFVKEEHQAMVKSALSVRDAAIELNRLERDKNRSTESLVPFREKLNVLYDQFVKKHGVMNSKVLLPLEKDLRAITSLRALEVKQGKEWVKSNLFSKRQAFPDVAVDVKGDIKEAISVSLSNRGELDLHLISDLMKKSVEAVTKELEDKDLIYFDPQQNKHVTADEYLSGNIYNKLQFVKGKIEFSKQEDALTNIMPQQLTTDQVTDGIRFGQQWIPVSVYQDFIQAKLNITMPKVEFDKNTASWSVRSHIDGKHVFNSHENTSTYGLQDRLIPGRYEWQGHEIIETLMNQKSLKVTIDEDQLMHYQKADVEKERLTTILRRKGDQLLQEFRNFIRSSPELSKQLTDRYNNKFNSIVLRTYDGEAFYGKKEFPGLNPIYKLMKHQKDVVVRTLQQQNTLYAHVVGAGKTLEMQVSIMEGRRLGLIRKPVLVVPSFMLEQHSREFKHAYPNANIKVLGTGKNEGDIAGVSVSKNSKWTEEKFEQESEKNRMLRYKSLADVMYGDYDVVIMTYEGFERIPVSPEFEEEFLRGEIDKLRESLNEFEDQKSFTVKQIEKAIEKLETRIKNASDRNGKDVAISFEEIGFDAVFVDEAHNFKNLMYHSKMGNIGGLSNSSANRSLDMYMKTSHMNNIGGKTVFATGTPIANSVAEMFTMLRYLAPKTLEDYGMEHFDGWASQFGTTINSVELNTSGKFIERTRFAEFTNVPELMNMFKAVADVKMAEDLPYLKRPEVERETVTTPMSANQRTYLELMIERATQVAGGIEPQMDNMLKLTGEGKKLALDYRIIDGKADNETDSKLNTIAEHVVEEYFRTEKGNVAREDAVDENGKPIKTFDNGTQLVFMDLGVPKADDGTAKKNDDGSDEDAEDAGSNSMYQNLKDRLLELGVKEKHIAFIHDYNKPDQKKKLSEKFNAGEIRIIIGSTGKMGVGMNLQKRLTMLHHADPTWRPADIEQREGRIIRQGNQNPKVKVKTYVTEGSFDALMWNTLENKAKFISQVMSGGSNVRSMDEIAELIMSYSEIKASATNNKAMKELLTTEKELRALRDLEGEHNKQQAYFARRLKSSPQEIAEDKEYLEAAKEAEAIAIDITGDNFIAEMDGVVYSEKARLEVKEKEKGKKKEKAEEEEKNARQQFREALLEKIKPLVDKKPQQQSSNLIGTVGGLELRLDAEQAPGINVKGELRYKLYLQHTGSNGKILAYADATIPQALQNDGQWVMTKIQNAIRPVTQKQYSATREQKIKRLEAGLKEAQEKGNQPFPQKEELEKLMASVADLREEARQFELTNSFDTVFERGRDLYVVNGVSYEEIPSKNKKKREEDKPDYIVHVNLLKVTGSFQDGYIDENEQYHDVTVFQTGKTMEEMTSMLDIDFIRNFTRRDDLVGITDSTLQNRLAEIERIKRERAAERANNPETAAEQPEFREEPGVREPEPEPEGTRGPNRTNQEEQSNSGPSQEGAPHRDDKPKAQYKVGDKVKIGPMEAGSNVAPGVGPLAPGSRTLPGKEGVYTIERVGADLYSMRNENGDFQTVGFKHQDRLEPVISEESVKPNSNDDEPEGQHTRRIKEFGNMATMDKVTVNGKDYWTMKFSIAGAQYKKFYDFMRANGGTYYGKSNSIYKDAPKEFSSRMVFEKYPEAVFEPETSKKGFVLAGDTMQYDVSPKTARDVSHKLAKSLKTVLRPGNVGRRKAIADFTPHQYSGNVKNKYMHNLRVTAHELGHAFEERGFNGNQVELMNVGATYYPGWSELKTNAQRKAEGRAELFTLYVLDPDEARSLAPLSVREIEDIISRDQNLQRAFEDVDTVMEKERTKGDLEKAVGSIHFPSDKRFGRNIGDEYQVDPEPEGLGRVETARYKIKGVLKKRVMEILDFKVPWQDVQKALSAQNYNGKDIVKMLAVTGNAELHARNTFDSWARDHRGRYIINYESVAELPDYMLGLYGELDSMNPNRLNPGNRELIARYSAAYKEFKGDGMTDADAKEKAILQALSSRSLKEIAEDGLVLLAAKMKDGTLPQDLQDQMANIKQEKENKESVEMNAFSALLQAYRANERYSRVDEDGNQKFPEVYMDEERAARLVEKIHNELPELEQIITEYTTNLSDIILTKLVEAGVETQEARDRVENGSSFYVPTYYAERSPRMSGDAAERKTAGKPIRAFRGRQAVAVDFLRATTYKLLEVEQSIEFKRVLDEVEKGLRQRNMGVFGEIIKPSLVPQLLNGAKIAKQIGETLESILSGGHIDANDVEQAIAEKTFTTFFPQQLMNQKVLMNWHGDTKVFIRLAPDLYNSIVSMKPIHIGPVMRWFSKASSFTRKMAITNPRYLMNAMARDFFSSGIQNNAEQNFISGYLKGMALAAGKDPKMVDQYITSGAFMSAQENVIESFKRAEISDGLIKTKVQGVMKTKAGRFVHMFMPENILKWQEQIARYGVWEAKAKELAAQYGIDPKKIFDGREPLTAAEQDKMEKILLELGYEASEVTTNFRTHGTSTAARQVIAPISFLHGTLQGIYREMREVKTKPVRTLSRIGLVVAPMSLLSWALLQALDQDDKDDITSEMRDKYWIFPVGNSYFFIAKPFGYAIPAAYGERMMDDLFGGKDARKWNEEWTYPIEHNFLLPMLPIYGQGALDLYSNKAWYGGKIVSNEYGSKAKQIDSKSSKLAEWQFKAGMFLTGDNEDKVISPDKFDYAIRQIFGGPGHLVSDVIDKAAGKDRQIFKPQQVGITPKDQMGSRFMDQFYTAKDKDQKKYERDILAGKAEKGKPSPLTKGYRQLSDYLADMRKLNEYMKTQETLPAKQKIQLERQIKNAMNDVARWGTGREIKDEANLQEVITWVEQYRDMNK